MSILSLPALNKNEFRRYPFKQTSDLSAIDGYSLPDNLITSCSLTSRVGKHRVYMKQLFYNAPTLRIAIASISDDPAQDDVVLGVFDGVITESYTTIMLTAFERYVSGSITLGNISALAAINRVLNFSRTSAEFEESTIFCYTPPAVTSIRDNKNSELRGAVEFGVLTNLTKITANHRTSFRAASPEAVQSLADKSSYLNNCETPIIKSINGVLPSPAGKDSYTDNDSNIYIAGVKPVVFYGIPGEPGVVHVSSEGVTLDSLCTQKHKLLPPVNISGFTEDSTEYRDLYYNKPAFLTAHTVQDYPYEIPARLSGNFYTAKKPEYYYWPQFVKKEYYGSWRLTAPSVPTILPTTGQGAPEPGKLVISFASPINEGSGRIVDYEYAISSAGEPFSDFVSSGITQSPIVLDHVPGGIIYGIKLRAINSQGLAGPETAVAYYSVS